MDTKGIVLMSCKYTIKSNKKTGGLLAGCIKLSKRGII